MTAYPQRKVRPRCPTGKAIYESVEKAEAITAIMQIRHGMQFRVYGCPSCGCYHVTKQVDRADHYRQLDIEGELLEAAGNLDNAVTEMRWGVLCIDNTERRANAADALLDDAEWMITIKEARG